MLLVLLFRVAFCFLVVNAWVFAVNSFLVATNQLSVALQSIHLALGSSQVFVQTSELLLQNRTTRLHLRIKLAGKGTFGIAVQVHARQYAEFPSQCCDALIGVLEQ